jgi:hypothetical protein
VNWQTFRFLVGCAVMLLIGLAAGFFFALFLVAYGVPIPVASMLATTTVTLLCLCGWKKAG